MTKKVIVVGGGFAGLTLIKKLNRVKNLEVLLIDQNNYYQFQPLLYQVATAGLEPSNIIFPYRKILRKYKNIRFVLANVLSVHHNIKELETSVGTFNYDFLVLAMGATNNFFGNDNIEKNTIPMKSLTESLNLRNTIFGALENAVAKKLPVPDVVVVGGGPTGVEIAGAIAEMKKHILPKDYPELNFEEMDIHLVQGGNFLLDGMKENLRVTAANYLQKMGVQIHFGNYVADVLPTEIVLKNETKINSAITIWAAGIKANTIVGIPDFCIGKGGRLLVNEYNELVGIKNIFCIGDQALIAAFENGNGHPQMAQVAMQQASLLAKNIDLLLNNLPVKKFNYKNKGVMATIGRNKAVVDLKKVTFSGWFAWIIWLFVHLMSIVGVRNKLLIFFNWMWSYLTYDLALRFIIKKK